MVNFCKLIGLASLFVPLAVTAISQPAIGQMGSSETGSSETGSSETGSSQTSCPAALDRFETHTVAAGETLSTIAASYRLQPQVLASFNPSVGNTPATGTTLQIPPFSGRVVAPAAGDTWQSLAKRYGARADVLFEINGCQSALPNQVFIPNMTPVSTTAATTSGPVSRTLQLPGYPLSQPAEIILSYGWQPSSSQDELVFNNGIAFAVNSTAQVRAAGNGTVAFAGEQEGYGQLLVINHAQGVQTRYANLSDISVVRGQSVTTDMVVGTIDLPNSGPNSGPDGAPDGPAEPTYLYFEVRTNSEDGWIAQDPGQYLPALELR